MSETESIFALLESAVSALPPVVRQAGEFGFRLPAGLPAGEVASISRYLRVQIPQELETLYQQTYGAQLGEFWLMTADEIRSARREMKEIYGLDWRAELLPFLWVKDTGDHLVLDLSRQQGGLPAVLDAFHEQSPSRWPPVCYGLAEFFSRLVAANFEPFWLTSSRQGSDD